MLYDTTSIEYLYIDKDVDVDVDILYVDKDVDVDVDVEFICTWLYNRYFFFVYN